MNFRFVALFIAIYLLKKTEDTLCPRFFILANKEESGTEIGNSLEFDFVVPPPHS